MSVRSIPWLIYRWLTPTLRAPYNWSKLNDKCKKWKSGKINWDGSNGTYFGEFRMKHLLGWKKRLQISDEKWQSRIVESRQFFIQFGIENDECPFGFFQLFFSSADLDFLSFLRTLQSLETVSLSVIVNQLPPSLFNLFLYRSISSVNKFKRKKQKQKTNYFMTVSFSFLSTQLPRRLYDLRKLKWGKRQTNKLTLISGNCPW